MMQGVLWRFLKWRWKASIWRPLQLLSRNKKDEYNGISFWMQHKTLTVECFQWHNELWEFWRVETHIIKPGLNVHVENTECFPLSFYVTFVYELQSGFWALFSTVHLTKCGLIESQVSAASIRDVNEQWQCHALQIALMIALPWW